MLCKSYDMRRNGQDVGHISASTDVVSKSAEGGSMSILINGVDMPRDGKEIQLRIDSHGEVYVYNAYPTIIGKAVEVPTPHGRLFEEQKLIRPIVETLTVDEINKVTSIFMNVPATIEAEE